ncbi:response regulator [Cellulosilyticum lentocellum]|uniref:Stage 0 sporulation protein A homolog n=1 Tax=Cellulosilyticum lentocellum (strain ATCC 49066 / DSM 5427 / NCIMB 11756 / RHM5) TaxID=642492 RepID=F2JPU6_CELLD|nr:response regulator transcription factor [Cellulosilyticum lentocellum]ADZ84881.1 two component transcriptional regulator, LuxR family [Cellulosilyticum lentocellum DSM 5427]
MIHIILVDDDAMIREGLKMIIETQEDFILDAVCENGEKAIEACRLYKPEVTLLDIRMPGMNGIEVAKLLIEENISKPLLLTTFDEPDLILNAMKANVYGYILKSASADTMLSAIRTVALGGNVFQKDVMDFITSQVSEQKQKENHLFDSLTEREVEVAAAIAEGLSNKEIGKKLFISDGTVRNHISVILSKTGLEHRTQIAVRYLTR